MSRPRAALAALFAIWIAAPACGLPEEPRRAARAVDVSLPLETLLVQGVVPPRTTLDALLRSHGLEADVTVRVVDAVRGVFDPRRLRSLQPFQLERTVVGALRGFEYEIDADSFLRVRPVGPSAEAIHAEVLPIPKTREMASVAGEINADAPSLFAAMKAAGGSDDLALTLAGIFSGEIDFNSEVQPGDAFKVVFERFRRDRGPVSLGEVTVAEYVNEGRVLRAILFTPPDGRPGRYDEQGRSLKRFFLRSPLKFEPRVTSGFSMRRMHPVLHTARAHRGVDYAAPPGSPVVSVAPGTVISVTSDSTNGRMVRIRHSSGYETYYLHLSRFAAGLRARARVDQGDVIGYVGSSGLATGPHLHYGLTKNGAFVNPIAEHRRMPPGAPIAAAAMPAFRIVRDKALAGLAAAGQGAGQIAQSDEITQLPSSGQP
jgi:murein DD-endopeptidase MepM/ murein hydrolase activator NlpD